MTVAVDWDDTLVDYKTQHWLPGAPEALQQIMRLGCDIVIHSCRANWPEGLASIEAKVAQIPQTYTPPRAHRPRRITVHTAPGKPNADVYIDDKALPFAGNWPLLVTMLAGRLERRVRPYDLVGAV